MENGIIERICEGGAGSEASVWLELRTKFPGIGGTIITSEGVATANRKLHSPSVGGGNRMFIRHMIIKKISRRIKVDVNSQCIVDVIFFKKKTIFLLDVLKKFADVPSRRLSNPYRYRCRCIKIVVDVKTALIFAYASTSKITNVLRQEHL